MRLSYLSPFSKPEHRRAVIDYAQLAESCGYDMAWVPEAFSSDAFTLLAAIATHTKRLKVATGIVNIYSRSPALLAQTFATLDEMSDGRAVIGLGTSGPIVVENWHGIPFEKPVRRMREVVEILRMALEGERVNYSGQIFKLQGFQMLMRPVQARIPIYLATFKPNAVRQTGEIADGWLPTHVSVKNLPTLRAALDEGAAVAKRDPRSIDMAALTLAACDENGDVARALCAQHLAYYVGGMGTFYGELMHEYGYGEIAERIQALWKNGDREGATRSIPRDVLDDLVVAGTRDECRAALDVRRRAGFTHIAAFPPHGANPDQVRRTLRAIAA